MPPRYYGLNPWNSKITDCALFKFKENLFNILNVLCLHNHTQRNITHAHVALARNVGQVVNVMDNEEKVCAGKKKKKGFNALKIKLHLRVVLQQYSLHTRDSFEM